MQTTQRTFSSEPYLALFTDAIRADLEPGRAVEMLMLKHQKRFRCKTIKCGDVLHVEVYPLWPTANETRKAKSKMTREVQQKLNDINAQKRFTYLVDTNFTENDQHVTLTYQNGYLPDEKQALKDMQLFIRRAKRYCKKQGMPPLKYMYVIEFADGDGRRKRIHHHAIMPMLHKNAAENRDILRKLWGRGGIGADLLDKSRGEGSLIGLAKYITKQPGETKKSRRWGSSQNLKAPQITHADKKLTVRQIKKMAEDVDAAPAIVLQKAYPGYKCIDSRMRYAEGLPGPYITAVLATRGKKDAASKQSFKKSAAGAERRRRTNGPV